MYGPNGNRLSTPTEAPRVDSTGGRNELRELLRSCQISECLAGPSVEEVLNCGKILATNEAQIGLDLTDSPQWNEYVYANSSPLTLFDPTGLRPMDYSGAEWKQLPPKPGRNHQQHPQQQRERRGGSGGSGTVDPPVKSGEEAKTPAPDYWSYLYKQGRAPGSWSNHYLDKLGACGLWVPEPHVRRA